MNVLSNFAFPEAPLRGPRLCRPLYFKLTLSHSHSNIQLVPSRIIFEKGWMRASVSTALTEAHQEVEETNMGKYDPMVGTATGPAGGSGRQERQGRLTENNKDDWGVFIRSGMG